MTVPDSMAEDVMSVAGALERTCSFLIWTQPADPHAIAVERVLASRGHSVTRLFGSDIPERMSGSVQASNRFRSTSAVVDERRHQLDVDVVWLRRTRAPVLKAALEHPDAEIIRKEVDVFQKSFVHAVSPGAVWINTPESQLRGESKSLQLSLARKAGFQVPDTLISNCPLRIKAFLQQYSDKVIYKPFVQNQYGDGNGTTAKMRATVVSSHDLPSDSVVQSVPGIYQERIFKDFEVRLTVFGNVAIAAMLKSRDGNEPIDIKDVTPGRLVVEPINAPDSVLESCQSIMSAIGLRFASFDFVVRDGQWTFIELNQMGQFLWLERINPEIHLLSTMCQYLESICHSDHFLPVVDDVRLNEVLPYSESIAMMAAEVEAHPVEFKPFQPI